MIVSLGGRVPTVTKTSMSASITVEDVTPTPGVPTLKEDAPVPVGPGILGMELIAVTVMSVPTIHVIRTHPASTLMAASNAAAMKGMKEMVSTSVVRWTTVNQTPVPMDHALT